MHFSIPVFKRLLAVAFATTALAGAAQVSDDDPDALTFDRLFEETTGLHADAHDPYVYINRVTADAPFRRARRGILVVGAADTIRAMEPFTGPDANLMRYAATVNAYSRELGDSVTVYCMPIPTQAAFYCPDDAQDHTQDQAPAINRIFSGLDPQIVPVDLIPVLGEHASEDIYLRTDHHWSPLGAFYAAREFASAAMVPFHELNAFERREIPSFVGTMLGFSADRRLKNAPETFVYFIPNDVNVSTYYINYRLDRTRKKITSVSAETAGSFFIPARGVATYCTFMGGDNKLTRIETPTRNHRRLAILKDSYGNPLPAYLFNSFEEIHVIDCRYFHLNIISYLRSNGITDVLFANNMTHATMLHTCDTYDAYLTQ